MADTNEGRIGEGRTALLYARESQYNEHNRVDVETQLAAGRALAAALGYAVADETTVVENGPNTAIARPGMTTLIGLIAAGRGAAIITYTLDRLGRQESEGLEALLRELRRREIPLYLAHTPRGYTYDPATGKLVADAAEVHAANREDWREPEFFIIPRENEQDDLLADRLTFTNERGERGEGSAGR